MSDENETVKVTMSVAIPRNYELTVEVSGDESGYHEIVGVREQPIQSSVSAQQVMECFGRGDYGVFEERVEKAIEDEE